MDQNPLLVKIQRILNGMPDNERLFLDGLNSIFPLVKNSSIPNQRTLRSNLEEIQFSYYENLLLFFGDIKKRLDDLKTCVNNILETCLRMNGALNSVKSETVFFVDEAQRLGSDSKLVAIKAYLLELLISSYRISMDDAHILSSKVNYLDDAFFSALSHGKEIKNMCRELVQSNELTFCCSLMNEVTEVLNMAYENLYEWTQNECMNKVQETPEISLYLRRALSELQNKPVLLKYSLDEYVGARRKASVKYLLDTLTVEVDYNYSVRNLSLHIVHTMHAGGKSHNPVRLVSDILACAHQIAASEKEYINSLCIDCHDTLVGDLKIICLDTITESLCFHLKVNMENLLVSHHDAITLYQINNITRFYQYTFKSLLGSTASLTSCVDEIQRLWKRLLIDTLEKFVKENLEHPDLPNPDLSPSELISDTLQLLTQMLSGQDISLLPNDEVKVEYVEMIERLVSPLVTYCEKSARLLGDSFLSNVKYLDGKPLSHPIDDLLVSVYLANCLNAIQVSLLDVPFSANQIEQIAQKLESCLDSLVIAQVSFMLEKTGLLHVDRTLSAVQESDVAQHAVREMLVNLNTYLSEPDKFCLPEVGRLCSQQLRRSVRRRSADQIHCYYQSVYQGIKDAIKACCLDKDMALELYTPQQVALLILNF
ncbi:hypothetical protein MN116_004082 [Schistosoma mekongi]|uniref:Conserved oligomeric Golgi complex subunit 6 n=1 Tax=Schistosoma mekongi TaxID=38744 RepID=A0AAE2D675_SCHME|nr:hypothetical protein MN116_004082 [Schistosoma mekongi]